MLSTENCPLTPTKLFAGTSPQSTGCGELVLLNEHEKPENTAEITVVFVGGVPGRTRTAGARFATDPALFTAWTVRKHIPPSTGGSQCPRKGSVSVSKWNRPPQLWFTSSVPGALPPQLRTVTVMDVNVGEAIGFVS